MVTKDILDEMTRRLVKTYNPLAIYLFGSYAWGSPTEESDVDLLVIVKESNERRWKRPIAGSLALWGMGVPKDLLVYTKTEFDRALEHPSTLARKVYEEGKVLYASA